MLNGKWFMSAATIALLASTSVAHARLQPLLTVKGFDENGKEEISRIHLSLKDLKSGDSMIDGIGVERKDQKGRVQMKPLAKEIVLRETTNVVGYTSNVITLEKGSNFDPAKGGSVAIHFNKDLENYNDADGVKWVWIEKKGKTWRVMADKKVINTVTAVKNTNCYTASVCGVSAIQTN